MIMKTDDLKKDMMRLWKDTFHDSDEYIRIVFDAYFNPEFVECETVGDKLVAAMLAVPYEFGSKRNRIRGAYLCGLATRPEYQGRGVMTRLINRICSRMKNKGFSFVFLIPADEGLHKFYLDRGFVNAFYRLQSNYVPGHDFTNEYFNHLDTERKIIGDLKKKYYNSLETHYIERYIMNNLDDDIAGYLYNLERNNAGNVCHNIHAVCHNIPNVLSYNVEEISEYNLENSDLGNTDKYNEKYTLIIDKYIDIIYKIISKILELQSDYKFLKICKSEKQIITEIIENLISNGRIYYCINSDENIASVAFVSIHDDAIIINKIYSGDRCSCIRILESIKNDFPESKLKLYYSSSENGREAIWNYNYINSGEVDGNYGLLSEVEVDYNTSCSSEVYGMARILDFSEILKFLCNEAAHLNFSILVKEPENGDFTRYSVKDELIRIESLSEDEILKGSINIEEAMTPEELAALLFRRSDSSSLVADAFGFPPLDGSISLMLD